MNRILLIGNGFDLAHNLKTGYNSFIENLWNDIKVDFKDEFKPFGKEYPYSMADVIEIIVSCRNNRNLSSNTDWLYYNPNGCIGYPWFEEILKSYTRISEPENGLPTTRIRYINAFLGVISKNYTSKNWSGIETDYYEVLKTCLNVKNVKNDENDKRVERLRVEQLHREFSYIKTALVKYLNEQMLNNPVTEFLNTTRENIYSKLKLNEINYTPEKPLLEKTLFLSVNYTNTERLYTNDDRMVMHIHGELNNTKNPIIFGYGDVTDENYKDIEGKDVNEYLDNMKSVHYRKRVNYSNLQGFIGSDEYEVFIMGHSCGISDTDLLRPLFEDKHCLSIRVFPKNEKYGPSDYDDITKNMGRIFTDQKLMNKKLVPEALCTPLS